MEFHTKLLSLFLIKNNFKMKKQIFLSLVVALCSIVTFAQTKTVVLKPAEVNNKLNQQAIVNVPQAPHEVMVAGEPWCMTSCVCYSVTYYWMGGVPIVVSYTPSSGCNQWVSCGGITEGMCQSAAYPYSLDDAIQQAVIDNEGDHGIKKSVIKK